MTSSLCPLTLLAPGRLTPETRDALRFALRKSELSLVQLGLETKGADPVRLVVGRFSDGAMTQDAFIKAPNSAVFWLEREDVVDVQLINEVWDWLNALEDNQKAQGLMVKRTLEVDGEVWREHLVPRVWNAAAQAHLASGNDWKDIDWTIKPDIKFSTRVSLEALEGYEPNFLTESEDRLVSETIFFSVMGLYEHVLRFTDIQDGVSIRPDTKCMLETARAEALRYTGSLEEASQLSMSVIQEFENYPWAWFTFGCCALELGEEVRASGAFDRAVKSAQTLTSNMYHECSIWEWQALLGTLFSRVSLGDIDGVKQRMSRVFSEVPEHLAQRLTNELTAALLNQNEVMLAWEIVEPKLEKHALSMVPAILQIGEYYVTQEGREPAYSWMLRLSSNHGELLQNFAFVQVLFELADATNDTKTAHELLWVMVEFEQAPQETYRRLAKDLLGRGRIEEAEQIEKKRLLNFSDESV